MEIRSQGQKNPHLGCFWNSSRVLVHYWKQAVDILNTSYYGSW